ncbi:FtsH protease activity modulator HflK [Treponema endosymbiont of Eucomonympha sp.]|uniref:FtsH protease activity modulator HflK n=4 Tax=Treponema endosymbiont of Eucomonympha sp. TaxID=1580831 RepID=UPI000A9E96D0|nr:FtsH protease activity modulator HflK [Treponema endosymbiont of Eucomonympha sp.]
MATEYPYPKWKMPDIKLKRRTVLWICALAALLAVGVTGLYFVDETSQAVVTRLGRYARTVDPGAHFKLPFGIEQSYVIPTRVVQTEQFGFQEEQRGSGARRSSNTMKRESTMLTGDLNIIEVEWTIQYRIVDPKAWLFNVADHEKTIRDISQSVVNTLVGDRAILDVMRLERGPIETAAIELMNENFQQLGLGISVRAVNLQNVRPPEGVKAAFEDVNKSTQDMERLTNEGQESYNAQIPRAKGEAARLIQQANGYAIERVNNARGDAARFGAVYEAYRASPQITRERLYLETMESIFKAKDNQTLIDGKLDNVLPLKNISGGSVR